MLRVEVLAIGDELLEGYRLDTNSNRIATDIASLGMHLATKAVIRDDLAELTEAIRCALIRSELLFCIGGLGPTVDDLTREAIAAATGIPLEPSPDVEGMIRERFAQFRRPVTENNLRQAMVPVSGGFFPNANGTAPGLYFEAGGKLIIALPGPPREFDPMMCGQVIPFLRDRYPCAVKQITRVLRLAGMGESTVDQILREHANEFTGVRIGMLASLGLVDVKLTRDIPGDAASDAVLDRAVARTRELLGEFVYGEGDDILAAAVGRELVRLEWTLALAESCTGGLVAAAITDVPGSSRYFTSGWVTYSNEAKNRELGVDERLLREHGAVSEPVVLAMARGARERAGADIAFSCSGIAGPDGGSEEKPVGTVWLAVATADSARAEQVNYTPGRDAVRKRACVAGLDMIRKVLRDRR